MKFVEKDISVKSYPNSQNCLIYFLLDGGAVVYVGQTKQGLTRPFSHNKDKDFDEVKVIDCNADDLDYTEDCYIQKYQPRYNTRANGVYRWSLERARNFIRAKTGDGSYSKTNLRRDMRKMGIVPECVAGCGPESITFLECQKLTEFLLGGIV